jgi:phosphoribosylamine---glycine ligase
VSGKRVLVVGGGGREHALAVRLLESGSVAEVFVAPGNAGTRGHVLGKKLHSVKSDPREFARREKMDLVVVGPEAPLCAGLVDELTADGILTFGVNRDVAQLEGSKAFMKDFASRHGIRTARYQVVRSIDEAEKALGEFPEPPVVKADGLCAGKGVVVADTHEEAVSALHSMLSGERFGDAGRTVVLEERLSGFEMSVHAICDGERAFVFPPAQDHKRIGEGDTGPNTGGMGTFAPAPWNDPALKGKADEMVQRVVAGMAEEGMPYRGTLFAGLMIPDGEEPNLLEINVRFGDPETEVLMHGIDGDFAELLSAAARGELDGSCELNGAHALCVILAAHGYPASPRKGDVITGLDEAAALEEVRVYHAGTRLDGERVVTNGGRVLGVTGVGATLQQAHERAYRAANLIHFEGKQFRGDIGSRAL